ncbi:UNVERIFIED_CONTAM: nitrogen fixation protein FixH [Brevibacillus sp. OAP136]
MRSWRRLLPLFALVLAMLAGCGAKDETQKEPIKQQASADQYTADLLITPGIVGPNTYEITITDDKQQKVETGSAKLTFAMQGMDDHGKSEQQLKAKDGKWTAEGPHLMMDGTWDVKLIWTDEKQNVHTFTYSVTVQN